MRATADGELRDKCDREVFVTARGTHITYDGFKFAPPPDGPIVSCDLVATLNGIPCECIEANEEAGFVRVFDDNGNTRYRWGTVKIEVIPTI